MDVECRRCPYFVKEKDKLRHGRVIMGFCRLRQKFITDMTMGSPQCKDRALIPPDKL